MGSEYGWRLGELKGLRVEQLNFAAGRIRLDVGTTKNGHGRIAVMTANVRALLAACVEGKTGSDCVFTRDGHPIADFRKLWRKLCKEAGVPGLLFHDLRRSAVRNLVRAGVPEHTAMMITGHKTRAVFDRYDIVSERDLENASRKSEMRRAKITPSAEFMIWA
jgi:integrase